MKTERRHELQANQLAEFLTDVSEKAKPYAKGLLGIALAALVVVCAYLYLSRRSAAEEGESWNEAWQAIGNRDDESLRTIIKKYPDKPAAMWSQLVLADIELSRGVSGLFGQKSAGRDLIRSAYDDYQHVADHATHPLLREQALFGMGRAQESLNQLEKAREAYEKVVKDFPGGPYAKRAQQRLDELAHDSSKVFYDWFAAAEPVIPNLGKGSPFASPFDEPGAGDKSFPPLPPGLPIPDAGSSKAPASEAKSEESKAKPRDEAKPGNSKSEPPKSDSKPGDSKPADVKPGETKSPDAKGSPAKSDETKSAAPKSEPPKPAEPNPTPEKTGSAK
jgi:Tetratricopeptide repeat